MTGTSFIFGIVAIVTVASAAMGCFFKKPYLLRYGPVVYSFRCSRTLCFPLGRLYCCDSGPHLRGGNTGSYYFRDYAYS